MESKNILCSPSSVILQDSLAIIAEYHHCKISSLRNIVIAKYHPGRNPLANPLLSENNSSNLLRVRASDLFLNSSSVRPISYKSFPCRNLWCTVLIVLASWIGFLGLNKTYLLSTSLIFFWDLVVLKEFFPIILS